MVLGFAQCQVPDLQTTKSMKMNSTFSKRKLLVSLMALLTCVVYASSAQQQRDLLVKALSASGDVSGWSIDRESVFPKKEAVSQQLNKLPEEAKQQLEQDAAAALEYQWPAIPVSAYLDFVRNGDRTRMQSYQNDRTNALKSLVLAELAEQKGEYLDAIMDGAWAMCEQSTWVLSAHLSAQKNKSGVPDIEEPVIDLGAGEVANLLSWIHFYFREDLETISPLLARRIELELDERIISPYLARDDFWWMGFNSSFVNNWNPWCNYNVLVTASLLENDPERLGKVVEKTARSVDQFINYYKPDGACEEGPAYWDHAGGKMLEYLDLLKQLSRGKVDLGQEPLIQNMGNYIRKVHIGSDYYVNFADASARLHAHPGIIYRYGEYINDENLKGFAAKVAEGERLSDWLLKGSLDRAVHNLMEREALQAQRAYEELVPSFWYPQTEVAGGRSEGGLFFAAKGGHNNESHNHNDVGSFLLFRGNDPVFIDIGVETYSAKTFSKDRYDIWTMQSDFHNLPRINGFSQKYGKTYKAAAVSFSENKRYINFGLDLSEAYPEEAAVEYWKRTYNLDKKRNSFTIEEVFSLKEAKAPAQVHFMTLHAPHIEAEGKVHLLLPEGKSMTMTYPAEKLTLKIEEWPVEDARLLKVWESGTVYRMVFEQKEMKQEDKWVFSVAE